MYGPETFQKLPPLCMMSNSADLSNRLLLPLRNLCEDVLFTKSRFCSKAASRRTARMHSENSTAGYRLGRAVPKDGSWRRRITRAGGCQLKREGVEKAGYC
jgi:hypothetical protein